MVGVSRGGPKAPPPGTESPAAEAKAEPEHKVDTQV